MPVASRARRTAGLSAAAASALAITVLGPVGAAHAAGSSAIGNDPFTKSTCTANNTQNHKANVEPDSFAYGSTIVAAYQVGRLYDGGACAIGFSTSTDNGTTWTTSGLLPGITKNTTTKGPNDRATDASVAYDVSHKVWLISSLPLLESGGVHGNAVLTSRSVDGKTWDSPVTTATGGDLDKNWIACDNTASSPFFGNCYTEWDDHGNGNKMQMSTSTDGGLTWSKPSTNGAGIIGGQPVVQPNGTVVVPTANANETAIGSYRSTDGGATWSAVTTVATVKHHTVAGSLREGPLPSAEVAGDGTVYVAWSDCRFRSGCKTNDIVYSSSSNGTTWSAVTRVPIDATNSGVDHFIPGLAVNPASGTTTTPTKLALTYYFYPSGSSQLSVGFITSADGGANWSGATTVKSGMPSTWAANTTQGRMVGDYMSTSFTGDGVAHGVFGTAGTPSTGASTACTTSALDNCNNPIEQYTPAAPVAAANASATGPVLFSGEGGTGAQNLWNLVDNNGSKHRD
jgi:hypothetical protein